MIKLLCIFLCLIMSLVNNAQSLDSLEHIVNGILESNPNQLSQEEIQEIIDLSDTLLQINAEKSVTYIQSAIDYSKKSNDNGHLEMMAIGVYADGLLYMNKIDKMIAILESAISKYDGQSKDKIFYLDYGNLFQYLGFAYRNNSQFVKSAEQFSIAFDYFEKGESVEKQINAKYNQANLLTRVNYLDKAEVAFHKLLDLSDKPKVKFACYSSLGIVASKRKDYKKAKEYYFKSEELAEYTGEPEFIYMNIGINYRDLEDIENSQKYLLKAESICKETKRIRALGLIYPGIAKNFYETENYKEAKKYLALAEEFISSQNHSKIALIHEIRSNIFREEGNWEGAYDELVEKMIYRDSISDERRATDIADIEEKYQTEKKEAENELLKQNNLIKDATIERQRFILLSFIIGLGLLALLSFLFYRQSVERKRTNDLLNKKNEKIELLHKELGHRVKNNLAFISSLLKMQGRRLQNEEAKQAIKAGEARVEAMSLLHRKLYLEENINIQLGGYLQELCANLKNTYPLTGKTPTVEIVTDDFQIDGETAVRVGLIVNELMTNSFKHAFTNESNPSVYIHLQSLGTEGFQLTYQDNGSGISADTNILKSESMGLKLVHTLTKQLNGTLNQSNEQGASFQFHFKPAILII
jgi:two-component sensor histidine kinase